MSTIERVHCIPLLISVSSLQILKWLDTPSAFYDGPCEGIYLRIDDDTPGGVAGGGGGGQGHPYSRHRAKLVRPDFLQQIEEQWTRQQLTKNIIAYDFD